MAELLLVVGMAYVAWRLIDGARPVARNRQERRRALPWRLLIAGCLVVLVLAYLADTDLRQPTAPPPTTTAPEEVQP